MATNQQTDDLRAVLCQCHYGLPHPLGDDGCTSTVKAGNYGSWKPPSNHWGWVPRYPVADLYTELARHAPDKATREHYRWQARTARDANRYCR